MLKAIANPSATYGNQTTGIASTTKVVGSGATVDFAAMKVTDNNGSAVIDISATGVNATGANLYFKGTRHVRVTGGSSIALTTLGTDASLNCTLSVTWTSTNTFKISFANNTASSSGMAVTLNAAAAGGADGAAIGYIEYIKVL